MSITSTTSELFDRSRPKGSVECDLSLYGTVALTQYYCGSDMFLFNTLLDKQLWRKLVKVHCHSNANAYLKMKVGISTLTEAVDVGRNNDKSSHLFTYLTRGDVVCPLQTLIMIHLEIWCTQVSHVPLKGCLIPTFKHQMYWGQLAKLHFPFDSCFKMNPIPIHTSKLHL